MNEEEQGARKNFSGSCVHNRTKTDTGGLGEEPKVNGRTFVKELGKKARRKFAICLARRKTGRSESFPSDCLPKTQVSANPQGEV